MKWLVLIAISAVSANAEFYAALGEFCGTADNGDAHQCQGGLSCYMHKCTAGGNLRGHAGHAAYDYGHAMSYAHHSVHYPSSYSHYSTVHYPASYVHHVHHVVHVVHSPAPAAPAIHTVQVPAPAVHHVYHTVQVPAPAVQHTYHVAHVEPAVHHTTYHTVQVPMQHSATYVSPTVAHYPANYPAAYPATAQAPVQTFDTSAWTSAKPSDFTMENQMCSSTTGLGANGKPCAPWLGCYVQTARTWPFFGHYAHSPAIGTAICKPKVVQVGQRCGAALTTYSNINVGRCPMYSHCVSDVTYTQGLLGAGTCFQSPWERLGDFFDPWHNYIHPWNNYVR
ncbi:unnamed protein product [Durusdinium trenchii]|uniref:Uncharacterized protein n=1 Tax=Durusdinium trenchii TaxID=1381693 RepID=A0ABP0LD90_9DINO